ESLGQLLHRPGRQSDQDADAAGGEPHHDRGLQRRSDEPGQRLHDRRRGGAELWGRPQHHLGLDAREGHQPTREHLRPMYVNGFSFGSGPIRDGHDAFGANSPATTWYFAEGTTLAGFNEYLTLQNSGSSISNVTVTYFTDSGALVTRTLQLPATSRTTLE